MAMQKLKYREVQSPCAVCGKEAIESPIERLPKEGILYRAIHEDGIEHRWAEYSSITVGRERNARNENSHMKCPCILTKGPRKGQVCGKRGRINAFHRDLENHPEEISYQIVHGKLPLKEGTWGKDKQQKRERHYADDPKEREMILRRLKYYIEQTQDKSRV